jgi:hypothetical protein
MRTLMSFLIGLLTMAAVVVMGAVVVQNGQNAQLSFHGTSFEVAQGWLVGGAAALGFVLAFLLLIPGRLASTFHSRGLGRKGQNLEQRMQGLRDEYAQLQGSHQRLLEEHRHVLDQVLAPVAAAQGADPTRAPSPAASPAALTTPATNAEALQPTGPIHPPR